MSSSQNPPASSSLSTAAALWRLKPFVRPVIWRLAGGAASALAAAIIALMIPIVLEQIIQGPVQTGELGAIVWGAVAVLGLALGEALMVFLRRQFVLKPSTEVEYRMRTDLYARLQTLPVAFHDRWQSGQLLSRMMQDIGLIRRWLAFGLILLLINIVTMLAGIALLFRWHWALGVTFFVCSLPIWIVGYRFEQRYGALSRKSQDQSGDLATSVEESVHGIRVLKAFGRGGHALSKFRRQAESLRDTEMRKAHEVGLIWFWYELVPVLALGLCLLAGIVLASLGQLTVGELFAFFALAAALQWPMRARPPIASSRCSTPRSRSRTRPSRARSPSLTASSRSAACTSATPTRATANATSSTVSISCCAPARPWRSWAPPAAARRRSPRCRRASTM
jgi:ATP-binding cassette subfamily B protein